MSNELDNRLWIGNLDPRVKEYNLIKILKKCGEIEKFDLMFYRAGPLAGQPRGYAFVSFKRAEEHERALEKLNGVKIGDKHIVVRPANKVNYEELERPKPKIEIPCLTAGTSSSVASEPNKSAPISSKEAAIRALEAKLKQLENKELDFDLNKPPTDEPPLIQKYQFNKNKPIVSTKPRYTHNRNRHKSSRPYDRRR